MRKPAVKKSASKKLSAPKPARVKCSIGITMSFQYQSVRMDVGLEQDCDSDEITKTCKALWERCEGEIEKESDGAMDTLKDLAESLRG